MGAVRSRSVQLKADCTKCCGLCCVGPTFYADQGFGFDKPAHTPCANLRADFRCAIHDELAVRGFPACVTFDCYGAGQRVTQQLFGGESWRSSPDLAPRMFDAYYRYRALHELMALLELAAERVSWHEALALRRIGQHIDELCESGAATSTTLSIKDLRADVLNHIRGMLSTGLSGLASDDTLRERPERCSRLSDMSPSSCATTTRQSTEGGNLWDGGCLPGPLRQPVGPVAVEMRRRNSMSKANPSAPRVFVVPELMSSDPVEAGGLLEEYLEVERLEVERLGGADSIRERIEAYLRDPGVARKPAQEAWPKARELAGMSGVERQRWLTWDAQHWVDSSLRKVLSGKAPRDVFKLDAKKHARPTSAARDRNMCAEVLRLVERCDYSRAQAVERVAEVFAVSEAVVERAAGLWGWDAAGKKKRRQFVPEWEQKLRNAGELK